jgi:hypothetical protein
MRRYWSNGRRRDFSEGLGDRPRRGHERRSRMRGNVCIRGGQGYGWGKGYRGWRE